MVMNYGTLYEYFIDKSSPQYKCPFNTLYNTARVFTPGTRRSSRPTATRRTRSSAWTCGPSRSCWPACQSRRPRYFSVQLVDLYTFNYGYMGSRTTGNDGGCYHDRRARLGRAKSPRASTKCFAARRISIALIRTQLFNAADIDNVKKVQAGYKCQRCRNS